jgi:hypothetical protein
MSLHEERQRLNRRIRLLSKDLGAELRKFRTRISKQRAVEERGAACVYVPAGRTGYMEGEDVVPLCHAFLDEKGIDKNPPEPATRGKTPT